ISASGIAPRDCLYGASPAPMPPADIERTGSERDEKKDVTSRISERMNVTMPLRGRAHPPSSAPAALVAGVVPPAPARPQPFPGTPPAIGRAVLNSALILESEHPMLLRSFSLAVLLLAGAPALAADTPAADPCSTQRLLSRGGSFATASDGVRIWYKLAGREGAPVIAYLHGGPGYNAYVFEESAGRLLEETFRVLYLDQRGCGRSTFDGPI